MAYKVLFLFLALMLLVASCRSEEYLDDQDAMLALKDLLQREARANRQAEMYRYIRGGTNNPFIFGEGLTRKLPRSAPRNTI